MECCHDVILESFMSFTDEMETANEADISVGAWLAIAAATLAGGIGYRKYKDKKEKKMNCEKNKKELQMKHDEMLKNAMSKEEFEALQKIIGKEVNAIITKVGENYRKSKADQKIKAYAKFKKCEFKEALSILHFDMYEFKMKVFNNEDEYDENIPWERNANGFLDDLIDNTDTDNLKVYWDTMDGKNDFHLCIKPKRNVKDKNELVYVNLAKS